LFQRARAFPVSTMTFISLEVDMCCYVREKSSLAYLYESVSI